MFWFAFRSGYDSARAKRRPRLPLSAASALASPWIASPSAGSAAARLAAVRAWLRASMTASSVSRSNFMYPLTLSTRLGIRS